MNCRATLCFGLWLLLLGAGCRLMQTAVDVPGQAVRAVTPGGKEKSTADPVEVQQRLLRFADEFSAGMIAGVGKLQRGTNAIGHAEELKWRIMFGSETVSIASGPSAFANLLDMTVFVTVTRMSVENHWQPKVYGEFAEALLDACRNSETQIWEFVGTMLKSEQQKELREAITAWRQSRGIPETVIGVDHAFWRAALFLGIACVIVLVTMSLNRVLRSRRSSA